LQYNFLKMLMEEPICCHQSHFKVDLLCAQLFSY
jgi:hypothetical protein